MDINIMIKAPDLSGAIQSLADAIVAAGCIPVNAAMLNSTVPNAELIKQIELAPVGAPIQVYVEPPVQTHTQPPQQAVLVQAPQQIVPPVAAPTQAPAQQMQVTPPAQPQNPAPTTVQTFTMEQLAVAATQLMEAPGHSREELTNLLSQFGVQALTQLTKEQYGAFATHLRAKGAKI